MHKDELIEPLIDVLSGITTRYLRPSHGPQLQLNDIFLQLKNKHSSWEGFSTEWSEIAKEIVTSPHWVGFLFPHICEQKPDVVALVRRLNGRRFSPPGDAALVNKAYDDWTQLQTDISDSQSLLGNLIHELALYNPDPNSSDRFEFLSKYYTFIDILASHLIDPSWKALHRQIFRRLYHQKTSWKNPYCQGYPYQGFSRIGICGVKPTEERIASYELESYLTADAEVLDIGSNCGFLSLHIAERVRHVEGIEYNPYLILVAEDTKEFLGINNAQFHENDFVEFSTDKQYDAVFSLANHCTIDGNLEMQFEEYIAKIFYMLKPGGSLFFESHNVFGPASGEPGDDGDLNTKFEIVERYFDVIKHKMTRQFTPFHDIDKLFIILRRKPAYDADAKRTFDLESARRKYTY